MSDTPSDLPSGAPLVVAGQLPALSSDERTMAAVAHAAAGLFGLAFVG